MEILFVLKYLMKRVYNVYNTDWIVKPKDILLDMEEIDEEVEEEILPEHFNIKEKVDKSIKTPTGKIKGILKI